MKTPRFYLSIAVISAVVLTAVLRLSAGDRGVVDWVVVAGMAGAMLWALLAFGVGLYRAGRGHAVGREGRALTLWLVGLMNTVWARPGAEGTWTWWVGIVLLVLAVADTVVLYWRNRGVVTGEPGSGSQAMRS